jgi:hypothetical protein
MSGNATQGLTRHLLVMMSGPLIWSAHFSFLYGISSFGGSFGLGHLEIRALSWAATVPALAGPGIVMWMAPRGSITRGLAFLSLVAIAFGALVLWAVPL